MTSAADGDPGSDPRTADPDYDRHGGFPNFQPAQPGPGFGRFLAAMRRVQDLAVSADPDAATWDRAAELAEELDLVVTGSSDYHGDNKTLSLGEHTTDVEQYERLLAQSSGLTV